LTTMILVSIEQDQTVAGEPLLVNQSRPYPTLSSRIHRNLAVRFAAKYVASHLATPDDTRTAKPLRVH